MKPASAIRTLLLASLLLPWLPSDLPADGDPVKKDRSLFIVPVAYYTPETRIAAGLTGIWAFRFAAEEPGVPASSLRTAMVYTQNKQTQLQLYWDLIMRGSALRINGDLRYARYPQRFYGIGPDTDEEQKETYSSDTLKFRLNLDRRIVSGWNAGLHFEWNRESMRETEADGMLASGRLPGALGGNVSGVGVYWLRDTRDSTFAPRRGLYLRAEWDSFLSWLGGDFRYSMLTLDSRGYLPMGSGQQAAAQLLVQQGSGTIPFQSMPGLGGQNLLRGVHQGRFRDRRLLALQADWRVTLGRRFGGVLFTGIGQVAPTWSRLDLTEAHLTFGAGVRYLFKPKDGIGIRGDIGFFAGKPAFYLTVGEAF